jgi:shikimate dehydrogenase
MPQEVPVDRYAVVGNPVAHSLSPRIHAEFARQTGQNLSYEAIELAVDGFATGIQDLQRRGYAGVNVTVPFKRQAWELCDRRSALAEEARAVNTLSLSPNAGIDGDNTDGIGLTRDLRNNLELAVGGLDILLLGAGGAARGVLGPLLAESPRSLTIANRSPDRAVALARDFGSHGSIRALAFEALADTGFDLIINATSAGLDNRVPALPRSALGDHAVCYDMMYRLDAATAFVAWARSQGAAQAHDGLGMLVEQAAESFRLWRGATPRTRAVIEMLRPG